MNEKAHVTKELNARHRKVPFLSSIDLIAFFIWISIYKFVLLITHV